MAPLNRAAQAKNLKNKAKRENAAKNATTNEPQASSSAAPQTHSQAGPSIHTLPPSPPPNPAQPPKREKVAKAPAWGRRLQPSWDRPLQDPYEGSSPHPIWGLMDVDRSLIHFPHGDMDNHAAVRIYLDRVVCCQIGCRILRAAEWFSERSIVLEEMEGGSTRQRRHLNLSTNLAKFLDQVFGEEQMDDTFRPCIDEENQAWPPNRRHWADKAQSATGILPADAMLPEEEEDADNNTTTTSNPPEEDEESAHWDPDKRVFFNEHQAMLHISWAVVHLLAWNAGPIARILEEHLRRHMPKARQRAARFVQGMLDRWTAWGRSEREREDSLVVGERDGLVGHLGVGAVVGEVGEVEGGKGKERGVVATTGVSAEAGSSGVDGLVEGHGRGYAFLGPSPGAAYEGKGKGKRRRWSWTADATTTVASGSSAGGDSGHTDAESDGSNTLVDSSGDGSSTLVNSSAEEDAEDTERHSDHVTADPPPAHADLSAEDRRRVFWGRTALRPRGGVAAHATAQQGDEEYSSDSDCSSDDGGVPLITFKASLSS